jgi:hypothetical protein
VFPIEQARRGSMHSPINTASDDLWMDLVLECDANGHRQLNFTLPLRRCRQRGEGPCRDPQVRQAARDSVAAKPWVKIQ